MSEPQPTYTLDQLRARMLQDPETLAWYELFSANPDLRAEADMNTHDAENGTHFDGCHLIHRACAMVAAGWQPVHARDNTLIGWRHSRTSVLCSEQESVEHWYTLIDGVVVHGTPPPF